MITKKVMYFTQFQSESLADAIRCHSVDGYRSVKDAVSDTEKAEKVSEWSSRIQDLELDHLGGENASIMHELRFMYHGKTNGIHSASVSAAINTEGPYHRSSISWAPGIFARVRRKLRLNGGIMPN